MWFLFDSKTPTVPSGLNAAGTVPNGCASGKARVFRSLTPLNPVRPICSPAGPGSSAGESPISSGALGGSMLHRSIMTTAIKRVKSV